MLKHTLSYYIAETYPILIHGWGTLLAPGHESGAIAYLNAWRVPHRPPVWSAHTLTTWTELENCLYFKHTLDYLDFFDMVEIFNDFIENQYYKLDLCLIKNDLQFVFDENFFPHIKAELKHSQSKIDLKKFLFWIEYFIERGLKVFHIIERNKMNIATISH